MAGGPPMITLDDLAAGTLPGSRDEAVALMGLLGAAQTRLAASIAGLALAAAEDRLLGVDQAAAMLGVDRSWLYRRTRTLPFAVRLDGKLRFSLLGIQNFITTRRGR
jgi:predicted DNA-binding transcriptional regulator AlpA